MARVAVRALPGTLKNYCINGNFDFWQRGVSFSIATGGSYFADRFKYGRDGSGDTGTVSRQTFTVGQTSVPGNPTYFLRHDQTVAGTGTTTRALEHRIEDVSSLSGGTATVSFWAKADTSRTISLNMVQNFGSGGSALVSITSQSINLTVGWQRFSLTFTVPSISGKTVGSDSFISVQWFLPNNAIHTIDFAQIMINEGSAPTDFVLAGRTISSEFAACQRYYETGLTQGRHDLNAPAAATIGAQVSFNTTKRTTPSMGFVDTSSGDWTTSVSNGGVSVHGFAWNKNTGSSGTTPRTLTFTWTAVSEL